IDTFLYDQDQLQATRDIKAAAAATARARAEEMEVDTNNDILVGELVKREFAKTTAALRKEVNQLRATLNGPAGSCLWPTANRRAQ
ncbi:unnamed protein product, partial [Aphanomyces euteiches]